jgi:hypothetical protein
VPAYAWNWGMEKHVQMCSNVAPRVSRGGVRDPLNLISTKMFDKKYATSKVSIARREAFKGLEKVYICGFVVCVNSSAEDTAINPLAGASNSGITLRAEGRRVDYFVLRHHADISLERGSVLEEWSQQFFGLTLWADVKTTDDECKLKEGVQVSTLLSIGCMHAVKGHLLHRKPPRCRGQQQGTTASRACSDRMKPDSQ